MSSAAINGEVILTVMGFGVAMILFGVVLLVSWGLNPFYIVAGFFLLVLGMAAFVTPLSIFSRWDRFPVPKVRCRHCATLNYETAARCRNCGANMFERAAPLS
ncbi:hypothetical protein AUG19_04650 [archaeon 13_1_20CM_2_54_9]|nr:MAG: hypothetical protein AUJ07_09320 [Crenarchaeota archaeon 13_1_40CM_3_53_5]OLE75821.1 MAG: hypothetical protein AUG19_04650 [archaeon 13_1_20CM_2_54_9]